MKNIEFLVKYVLPDYFAKNHLTRGGCKFEGFEVEKNFDASDGFNSSVIFGRIVCMDKFGKQSRHESMAIKLIPKQSNRSKYIDITFSNEIFTYTRIIPFYGTFSNTVLSTFPKFYYATLALGEFDNENMALVLENISAVGYRETNSKSFLDFPHLLLIVKKLALFHACSYHAKITQPRRFHSLVENLVETHFSVIKGATLYYNMLNDHFTQLLDDDHRYKLKTQRIRELLLDADKFIENVFATADEPIAVICHGDFHRNNMMFKYDSEQRPVDVKFFDLSCAKYCSPVVDLALILYTNADQETRNKHWDDLIDAYCTTLRDTFPDIDVPTKDQILQQFKMKSLFAYVWASGFLPLMLLCEEVGSSDVMEDSFLAAHEGCADVSYYDISSSVAFDATKKMCTPYSEAKVLDVLKDIVDRGFI